MVSSEVGPGIDKNAREARGPRFKPHHGHSVVF